ncbi:MAG: pantoate--beta-alanine ligase [Bacteroidales bacterium]|nr:pantoate--beta-alanine ligase [Bacteroidales bacterium]
MKVFSTIDKIREYQILKHTPVTSMGMVPTMGALHRGHISLIEKAIADNHRVTVSIFVNPIQFNNPDDLQKYPGTIEKDLAMLDQVLKSDDIVFAPSAEEMYPKPINHEYDFGALANVMEGKKRPGHFNGVGIVVNKLLRIIEPDAAYFGEKDFQQLAIVRKLVRIESLPVNIIACPIIREPDGLAMSSRNARLSQDDRSNAPEIYQSLKWAREQFQSGENLQTISGRIIKKLNSIPNFKVEYLTFANESTLTPITQTPVIQTTITRTPVIQTTITRTPVIQTPLIRCFIAVFAGEIRLIDNIPVY